MPITRSLSSGPFVGQVRKDEGPVVASYGVASGLRVNTR